MNVGTLPNHLKSFVPYLLLSCSFIFSFLHFRIMFSINRDDVLASFYTCKPTEAMAAWYATKICKQMDARYIILEGDAKEITQTLQREST